jgi:ubiquinone/menaquinone biosynthesis C-methylase UbiE
MDLSVDDVGAAYDDIAPNYDVAVAGDEWVRRQLWQHYARLFPAGSRVLDLSCGTGSDAVFLAERGVDVVGLDASAQMVAECRRKVAERGLEHLVQVHHANLITLPSLEIGCFDGAISAFGGLNTIADLRRLSADVSRLLRPGTHFVVHAVNRFSLWEALGHLRHGRVSAAWRLTRQERRTFPIGNRAVCHFVFGPGETYARFFAADFDLIRAYGQGILRPPYTLRRVPARVAGFAGRAERSFAAWPVLRALGRFFVLDLERR